jgi:hypothetical protein
LFWIDGILEGNLEICVSGIDGDFFDFVLSYVAGEGFLDVPDAGSDIIVRALGEHFDSTIRTVSDKTGQPVSVGYVKSSVSKADTLNPADKNYMFCTLTHLPSYINLGRLLLQVLILSIGNSERD